MARISSVTRVDGPDAYLHWAEYEIAIMEWPDRVRMLDARGGAREAARGSLQGMAFGAREEIRWMKRDGGYHVVMIRDDDGVIWGAKHERRLETGKNGEIVMWGERKPNGVYQEGRIPGDLEYPQWLWAQGGQRAAVRIREYTLDRDGERIGLFRCLGLKAI